MDTKKVVELPALTGLRGFLALWVVAFHIYYILQLVQFPVGNYLPGFLLHFLDIGGLGVDGFFLLSGFVLAHVYTRDLHGKLSLPSARRFLLLRLARVYPVHLVLILVYAALKLSGVTFQVETCGAPTLEAVAGEPCKRFGLTGLIAQLTLTSVWGWHDPLTWNAPAWSISAEWTAYLAFPLLVQLTSRLRQGWAALVLAAASILLLGWYLSTRKYAWTEIPIDDVTPARIGFEFVAGMLMYRCYQSTLFERVSWSWMAVICLVVALALLQVHAYPLSFVVLFIPFILSLAQSEGPVSRFMASRGMVWLGAVSYSLYMGHILVVDILGVVASGGADEKVDPASALGLSVLVLGASLAVAAALYYLVEEPARRALRRFIEFGPRPS